MMDKACKECLYKVVASEGMWCYAYHKKPGGRCEQLIYWKAIRDFIGKMLVEAMDLCL